MLEKCQSVVVFGVWSLYLVNFALFESSMEVVPVCGGVGRGGKGYESPPSQKPCQWDFLCKTVAFSPLQPPCHQPACLPTKGIVLRNDTNVDAAQLHILN